MTLPMPLCCPVAAPSLAALLRIHLTYLWRHGRLPALGAPTRFTELIQLRKLYDRDERMPAMADKLAIKAIAAARLGAEWVVPALWSGSALPRRCGWAEAVVVKARHGCNQNAFIYRPAADWPSARRQAARWMHRRYGRLLDEWLYSRIPRGLLIEPFIGEARRLPMDYKFFVFAGQVSHIEVHLGRGGRHRWSIYDAGWRAMASGGIALAAPSGLSAMIAAAQEMARGFDFARVDFYQPGSQPLFGEITFYPGSGLHRIDPPALDVELGRLWLRAGAARLMPIRSMPIPGGEAPA